MRKMNLVFFTCLVSLICCENDTTQLQDNKPYMIYPFPIVDTGVETFYTDVAITTSLKAGDAFYGQDADYSGYKPSYTNNGNGTIIDNVTGLIWEQDMGEKLTLEEALIKADKSTLGGYTDWRVPAIKELYSLILFTGQVSGQQAVKMFIDTDFFNQPLGDISIGEREIDAQTWSSTV